MALDEPTNELEKLDSNGIIVYMDPRLKEHLVQFGAVKIDYVTNPNGQSGYSIQIGDGCGPGACEGCSSSQ
jgi:hypothetical protein